MTSIVISSSGPKNNSQTGTSNQKIFKEGGGAMESHQQGQRGKEMIPVEEWTFGKNKMEKGVGARANRPLAKC